MKSTLRFASLLGALLIAPGLAAQHAQDGVSSAQGYSPRGQLVHDLVMKWGPHVQETYDLKVGAWTREMAPVFSRSSLDRLHQAARARSFESMNDILLGIQPGAAALNVTPAALGSAVEDLVFTPVAPCRLFDTRLTGIKPGTGQTRDYDVTAATDYTAQGGSNTHCNVGDRGDFKAAVISFTVVDPVNNAYLTAYQWNTPRPFAATMTYKVGALVTNTAIVPLDQGPSAVEMSVYNNGSSHVVGDIVGYFDAPAATTFECTTLERSISVPAVGSGQADVQCDIGYEPSNAGCFWLGNGDYGRIYSFPSLDVRTHTCFGNNSAIAAQELHARARCCRVPGK